MRTRAVLAALLAVAVLAGAPAAPDIPAGVVLRADGLADRHRELADRIAAAPPKEMTAAGLAGATGGVRVRVTAAAPQEVILPVPQLTGGQAPVALFVSASPADAVTEFRLRVREGGNAVLGVKLVGKPQEVRVEWSAVVLLGAADLAPDDTPAGPYKTASGCAQAGAAEVAKLAADTWPAAGGPAAFAAGIQRHVRDMKPAARPRSLDAVGILKSGENGICTANANLAAALMRAKGVPCRSLAVIPTTGQRLEMHRVAEYSENGRWVRFDPSSLQPDIPLKPWHGVVMARTTPADEKVAMTPRMGAMVGCPYGQEAELLTPGVTLFGEDFFWTLAKPLAAFDPGAAAAKRAAAAWRRTLETGTQTPAQVKAASARTAAEFAEALKAE